MCVFVQRRKKSRAELRTLWCTQNGVCFSLVFVYLKLKMQKSSMLEDILMRITENWNKCQEFWKA